MAGQTTEHGFQPEVEIDMQNNYCTCGRESLTSTTCVADAIHYGFVLSSYLDLPFNDILDWKKFSLVLTENDVYHRDIRDEKLTELHKNLLKVQKHFEWHLTPVRLDAFHMVMYSLWKRRHA
ncbi:UDP-Xyl: xylogalacturonan beta-1,3-xylosyltransferase, family GT47 [Fagus crenata]